MTAMGTQGPVPLSTDTPVVGIEAMISRRRIQFSSNSGFIE